MSFHVGWKRDDRCRGLRDEVVMDLERVRGTDRVNERIENIVMTGLWSDGRNKMIVLLLVVDVLMF